MTASKKSGSNKIMLIMGVVAAIALISSIVSLALMSQLSREGAEQDLSEQEVLAEEVEEIAEEVEQFETELSSEPIEETQEDEEITEPPIEQEKVVAEKQETAPSSYTQPAPTQSTQFETLEDAIEHGQKASFSQVIFSPIEVDFSSFQKGSVISGSTISGSTISGSTISSSPGSSPSPSTSPGGGMTFHGACFSAY